MDEAFGRHTLHRFSLGFWSLIVSLLETLKGTLMGTSKGSLKKPYTLEHPIATVIQVGRGFGAWWFGVFGAENTSLWPQILLYLVVGYHGELKLNLWDYMGLYRDMLSQRRLRLTCSTTRHIPLN